MTNNELNKQIDEQFENFRNALEKRFNGNCQAGFTVDGERTVKTVGDGWDTSNPIGKFFVNGKTSAEFSKLLRLLEQGEFDSFTIRMKWGNGVHGKYPFGFSYSGFTKAFFARKGTTPTLVGV